MGPKLGDTVRAGRQVLEVADLMGGWRVGPARHQTWNVTDCGVLGLA